MKAYDILIDGVLILSLPYKYQKNHLSSIEDSVMEETISRFNQSLRVLPYLMDEKDIPYDAVKKILYCNTCISLNLSVKELKSDIAFKTHEDWESIRFLAIQALEILGEP